MSNRQCLPPFVLACSPRRINFYRTAAIGALLAFGLGTTLSVSAGGIVHDPKQTWQHMENFRAQAQRWQETAEHYRKQLIGLDAMGAKPTLDPDKNSDFPLVNPDYGLQDACRGKKSDGGKGLIGTFAPSANGDILAQQLDICRRIVRAENLKYNETVQYLNNLRARQRELNTIDTRRKDAGSEPGKLQAVNFDISRVQQASKMDIDNWQAMIMAYDSYIAQLNKYQQRLAQKALRGEQPDVLTAAAQAAAFKAALEKEKNK
jgi:hypothetical protein